MQCDGSTSGPLRYTPPAGKTVALVGERGCGKSTTIELLKRAYDPDAGHGQVLLNGKPMKHWNVRSCTLRAHRSGGLEAVASA